MNRRDFLVTGSLTVLATGLEGCAMAQCTKPCRPWRIEKLGVIDIMIVESSPIVFKGKPYLMEYIRWKTPFKRYRTNDTGKSYLRFRDLTDMKTFTPPFGVDLHLASAFVENDRVYVTGTLPGERDSWAGHAVAMVESDDLIRWTEPRVILSDPTWEVYNTSLCKADGRYVLAFELGAPKEKVGRAFTMFFAESDDLRNWKPIDDAVFGREFYTGAPLVRYHGGWFYFFFLQASSAFGKVEYRTRVARSCDLRKWEISANVVLNYDPYDRKIHPLAEFTDEELAEIRTARNLNASDLDFCEYRGKLICSYSWGDQAGHEFLCLGEVNATEREFCESLFDVPSHVIAPITQAGCYENMHPRLAKAFAFLRRPDLATLKPGRYEIDGENCWANISDANLKPVEEEMQYEAHRRYIDIQAPLTGPEVMGIMETPSNVGPFNVKDDYVLFKGKGRAANLVPGEFALFFPYVGAHAPGRSADGARMIRKLVIKIRY